LDIFETLGQDAGEDEDNESFETLGETKKHTLKKVK
jgi:hypothetical protein